VTKNDKKAAGKQDILQHSSEIARSKGQKALEKAKEAIY
jgi:hypothetical protein